MTTISEDSLRLLKGRLATIEDLGAAGALLAWDQQTQMPGEAVAGRAEQFATMSRLSHEMFVSDETRDLLENAPQPEPDSEDEALLRVTRRDYDRATKIPADLVTETARARALGRSAWQKAREESKWETFAPHLEKMISLKQQTAEHLGYEEHPYDALLDGFEQGMTKARLEAMFEELKTALVPMIEGVSADTEDRTAPLHGGFDEAKQEKFGAAVISAFGYDWSRGRQDRVAHPFCIPIGGPQDVRITTRFDPAWLSPALFATMHESGHALYEQGVDSRYSRTPLSGGVSFGVHESQSRLWENLVGRSRPFWSHYYPKLQETFRENLGGVDFETFYRAANASEPSEIRVEADELTYNLHIMIRFELEVSLLEGRLPVPDLPEAWNAKMEEYLGITPGNDARGVLQDVHWSEGLIGYFPTYTIGNVLSVQIFDEAMRQHPEIVSGMERGEFATLREWLRENIHQHGKRYEPDQLIERATGRAMETAPYLRYLNDKFGELYGF